MHSFIDQLRSKIANFSDYALAVSSLYGEKSYNLMRFFPDQYETCIFSSCCSGQTSKKHNSFAFNVHSFSKKFCLAVVEKNLEKL